MTRVTVKAMGNTQTRASSQHHHHHHHHRCPPPPQRPSVPPVQLPPSTSTTLLAEAHGIVEDMLADPDLPPNVVTGLRTLSVLLNTQPAALTAPSSSSSPSLLHLRTLRHPQKSPGNNKQKHHSVSSNGSKEQSPSQQSPTSGSPHRNVQSKSLPGGGGTPRRRRASLILPYFRCASDNEEIPFTGEKPTGLPKRLRKNLPPSLLRRMSATTWTTTTTATGMPTLEPEPLRKRSTSFRNLEAGLTSSQPFASLTANNEASTEPKPPTTISTATSPFDVTEMVSTPSQTTATAVPPRHLSPGLESLLNAIPDSGRPGPRAKGTRSFSTTAIPSGRPQRRNSRERKTVCSLHPLTPQDVQCLSKIHENAKSRSSRHENGNDNGENGLDGGDDDDEDGSEGHASPDGEVNGKDDEGGIDEVQERRSHDQIEEEEEEEEEDEEEEEEDGLELPPLPSFRRLNPMITSDYESSNDSPPSGSDSTSDDVTASHRLLRMPRHVGVQTGGWKNVCSLCGRKGQQHLKLREPEGIEGHEEIGDKFEPETTDAVGGQEVAIAEGGFVTIDEDVVYDLDQIASDRTLGLIDIWDFPIFDMERQANQHILSQMCYRIFLATGLFDSFRIPLLPFFSYFHALERGYRDKPYHNRMHASDVLHGVYYLISQPVPGFVQVAPNTTDSPLHRNASSSGRGRWLALRSSDMDDARKTEGQVDEEEDEEDEEDEVYGMVGANFPALEIMALYAAAAMHDYDHPGRTNAFLVATFSPQAILYNDRSVLENHHAAAAWSLFLSKPGFNWLRGLDKAEFKRFRYLVIECILATDLKRHFDILAEFNAKVNEEDSPGLDWTLEPDRLLAMQMAIKLADINGPCKCREIHIQWTHRIAQEFYEQGDEELKRGLPISPFMDRTKPQLAKLQESFINHLVAPLCNAYGEGGLLPGVWVDDDELELEEEDVVTEDDGDRQLIDSEDVTPTVSDVEGEPSSALVRHRRRRKILCQQTKNLQENYEYWIGILKIEQEQERLEAEAEKEIESMDCSSVHVSGEATSSQGEQEECC